MRAGAVARNYAEALLDRDQNAETRTYLKVILEESDRLLSLVNDILDLSKIEAGRAEIIRKPFTVRAWVLEISKQLEGLAQNKNVAETIRGMALKIVKMKEEASKPKLPGKKH